MNIYNTDVGWDIKEKSEKVLIEGCKQKLVGSANKTCNAHT